MVHAVANAAVPKITLVIGASRRRQLCGVRPRVPAALPLHVAQLAHLRDGRRAGRRHAVDGSPAGTRRGRGNQTPAATQFKAPIREQFEREGSPYRLERTALGRRHPRSRRLACGAGARTRRHREQPDSCDADRRLPHVAAMLFETLLIANRGEIAVRVIPRAGRSASGASRSTPRSTARRRTWHLPTSRCRSAPRLRPRAT